MRTCLTARWVRMARGDDAERGASLVEYALLVSLIAVVCLVAVTTLGTGVNDQIQSLTSTLAA